MSPNTPITDAQRNAVNQARAIFSKALTLVPRGTIESVEDRARRPDLGSLPADVTLRVEIAPPSPEPHPLLVDTGVLKTPERVPLYFYALRGNGPASDAEDTADADPVDTHVIFFIHGGGNITGHPTHLPFMQFYAQILKGIAARAGAATKWVLVAPSYRLATAPENVFPAGLQDLLAAYDHVLGKGYDPSNVFVGGDSAGGSHAIVLTHLLLHGHRPAPRGIVAVAPGSARSLEYLSADFKAHAAEADILDIGTYEAMGRAYLGDSGVSVAQPLVSGALVPFSPAWLKTLVLVGTSDHLIGGARELTRQLEAAGGPVELVEYEGRPHGWWVMPNVFPENVLDAVERIARFVLI